MIDSSIHHAATYSNVGSYYVYLMRMTSVIIYVHHFHPMVQIVTVVEATQ